MKDFRPIWKDLANRKAITRRDVIQHCILRAMYSKGDTEAVLKHLLHKAFRPKNYDSNPFRAITQTDARVSTRHRNILGVDFDEIFESDEAEEFNSWAATLWNSNKLIRHYSYFFTRQDISPEYQLVQTAHAALELGNTLKPEQVKNLHFTCCGVANLGELYMIQDYLDNQGYHYVAFREPDIGNEITSIAVEPIAENKRGVLRNYPLLSFYRSEPTVLIQSMMEPAVEQVQKLLKGE
jgi:hypothetical protein